MADGRWPMADADVDVDVDAGGDNRRRKGVIDD